MCVGVKIADHVDVRSCFGRYQPITFCSRGYARFLLFSSISHPPLIRTWQCSWYPTMQQCQLKSVFSSSCVPVFSVGPCRWCPFVLLTMSDVANHIHQVELCFAFLIAVEVEMLLHISKELHIVINRSRKH